MGLIGRCYVIKGIKNGEADGVDGGRVIKRGRGFSTFDKTNDVSFAGTHAVVNDQRGLLGQAGLLLNAGIDLPGIDRIDHQPATAVQGFLLDAHSYFSDDVADAH